ncbi:hypothetical protein DSLASN_39520 [Desulfoluna limicola]|uniref:Uncharacterized protein n=1 Tax=Desulfoluna limicola TaxID=2810562 RepID=A0ABM7PMG9_9BACT|nr:hypothetical protein DSLASN_39520 [Desulfoluna limicola]
MGAWGDLLLFFSLQFLYNIKIYWVRKTFDDSMEAAPRWTRWRDDVPLPSGGGWQRAGIIDFLSVCQPQQRGPAVPNYRGEE